MSKPTNEPAKPKAHPRHIGIILKIGRERRPTGTTEFGGNIVLHEGTGGFHKDLERVRKAGYHLVDVLVSKIREGGWGAAKNGTKAWDGNKPVDPNTVIENDDGDYDDHNNDNGG